jgi:hypothetical protein
MTTAHPLAWPQAVKRTPSYQRKRASFGTRQRSQHKESLTNAEAARRLYDALDRLGAESLVISSNLTLNLDGTPKSNQREPEDGGVAIYFRRRGKSYAMPCDKWDRATDNMAAIAGHIDAIRSQERWGVGTTEQAFAGFEALPAPGARRSWREVLGFHPATTQTSATIVEAYRRLAKVRHPDAGGSDALMAELSDARDMALREIGS